MRYSLLYILCLGALILSSCSDNDMTEFEGNYLNGTAKTPIQVVTNLSTGVTTRAVNKKFESGDNLLAYIEAVKVTGATITQSGGIYTSGEVAKENGNPNKGLQTFTLTADAEDAGNVTTTDKLSPKIYWDDYSNTTYDLRSTDPKRGIRLYYGYCYNGGTPTTALTETTGVLGWTVQDVQTTTTKTSDLLFAKTQLPRYYTHNTSDGRGSLVLPYTHAMSKITIMVQCGEGFEDTGNLFDNTIVKLQNMQTKCTVDAPAGTVTASTNTDDIKDITMHTEEGDPGNTMMKVFTAMVAPTNLTVGNILANISEVAGVPYSIYITPELLGEEGTAGSWASRLTEVNEENIKDGMAQVKPRTRAVETRTITKGKGYMTKPGVNYVLVVTINKQAISVSASIADWDEAGASALGVINFSHDITDKNGTIDVGNYESFDIYRAEYNNGNIPTNGSFDNNGDEDGINPATKYSVDTKMYDPVIYWNDGSTKYYFRALSGGVSSDANSADITIKNGDGTNDNDVIWGTTEAHSGTDADGHAYNYDEGDAIAPRTGQVPLTFKHLLTKVSFNLKTSDDNAKAVNLEDAKIQISNIKNECRLNLYTGVTTEKGDAGYLYNDNSDTKGRATTYTDKTATLSNQIVTPQTIEDESYLIITLADGTVYKLQLNQCLVTDTNGDATADKVSTWAQGTHYTYTIHVEKEAITFRALIKDWVESNGSGNATLDWD